MKKHLFTFIALFLVFNVNVEAVPFKSEYFNIDEISFKDNQIKIAGKCKGRFDVKVKDINVSNKEKTTVYEVSIFNEDGAVVAKLGIRVLNKMKKRGINIIDASLKTVRDNVTHNSSNFINYGELNVIKNTEFEIPQFENVVKYLLSYNYF
jgi:predicted Fe-Mo cluster-binding NifX family protein